MMKSFFLAKASRLATTHHVRSVALWLAFVEKTIQRHAFFFLVIGHKRTTVLPAQVVGA